MTAQDDTVGRKEGVIWRLEAEDVCTVWDTTRRHWGDAFWAEDVMLALEDEKYGEVRELLEDRSGSDLVDLVMDAAREGPSIRDSSQVFLRLKRKFAEHGVELQCEEHWHLKDVIARAGQVEANTFVEPPRMVAFKSFQVKNLWDALATSWTDPRLCELYPYDFEDYCECIEGRECKRADHVLRTRPSDSADPSLFFLNVYEWGKRNGVAITFAPHPEHGDVLERARAQTRN